MRDEDLESLPAGPDPAPYLEAIREYEQAGFTHIYLHQIGRDQAGFFRFWREELQPNLSNRLLLALAHGLLGRSWI